MFWWPRAIPRRLRAVAGDSAADLADIAYFPSYEIIASHPSRAMFFNPDLRTVNLAGVDYVMRHFFHATVGFTRLARRPSQTSRSATRKSSKRYAGR